MLIRLHSIYFEVSFHPCLKEGAKCSSALTYFSVSLPKASKIQSGNLRYHKRSAFILNSFLKFYMNNSGERGRETFNSSGFKMCTLVWNRRCN